MTFAAHAFSDTRTLLRDETRQEHEGLDNGLMQLRPFEDLRRYTALVRAHHAFFACCSRFYQDAALGTLLPDLAGRDRVGLAALDLQDLRAKPADHASVVVEGDLATGLGWLYVAEGSKMGGAVLAKRASLLGLSAGHGARHLAPSTEGAAAHWRSFTEALNAIPLDSAAQHRAVSAAKDAFRHVAGIIRQEFEMID